MKFNVGDALIYESKNSVNIFYRIDNVDDTYYHLSLFRDIYGVWDSATGSIPYTHGTIETSGLVKSEILSRDGLDLILEKI